VVRRRSRLERFRLPRRRVNRPAECAASHGWPGEKRHQFQTPQGKSVGAANRTRLRPGVGTGLEQFDGEAIFLPLVESMDEIALRLRASLHEQDAGNAVFAQLGCRGKVCGKTDRAIVEDGKCVEDRRRGSPARWAAAPGIEKKSGRCRGRKMQNRNRGSSASQGMDDRVDIHGHDERRRKRVEKRDRLPPERRDRQGRGNTFLAGKVNNDGGARGRTNPFETGKRRQAVTRGATIDEREKHRLDPRRPSSVTRRPRFENFILSHDVLRRRLARRCQSP